MNVFGKYWGRGRDLVGVIGSKIERANWESVYGAWVLRVFCRGLG